MLTRIGRHQWSSGIVTTFVARPRGRLRGVGARHPGRYPGSRYHSDAGGDGPGRITDFGETGWITYDLKLNNPNFFGRDDLDFTTGYHYDHYELEIDQFNTSNFRAGTRDSRRNSSGGETHTHAVFGQLSWEPIPDVEVTGGLRWEYWGANNGFVENFDGTDPNQPDRHETKWSPKASMAYTPGPWTFRYSFARAHRFPIVQELFQNVAAFNSATVSNPGLEPENGTHHNFLMEYGFNNGYARVNVFRDDICDVIFNQAQLVRGSTISTFLPIDEVETTGVEFVARQDEILSSNLDLQFNVTWMDAEIARLAATPALEGNDFPRLPEWRANFFATYHVTPDWDVALGGRYQSDPFGRIDNTDTAEDVFGAQDEFFMMDFKTTYRPPFVPGAHVAFGIDNLTDENAFVFHPHPQRTFLFEAGIALD